MVAYAWAVAIIGIGWFVVGWFQGEFLQVTIAAALAVWGIAGINRHAKESKVESGGLDRPPQP